MAENPIDTRRIRLESSAVQAAMAYKVTDEKYRSDRKYHNLVEHKEKLHFPDTKYWTVVDRGECLVM